MPFRSSNNITNSTGSGSRGSNSGYSGNLRGRGPGISSHNSAQFDKFYRPLIDDIGKTPFTPDGPSIYATDLDSTGKVETDPLLQEQLDSLSDWQRFTDSIGLTNNAGQIKANYATAMDEREYNSVGSQIARMQEAGLNADILGAQGNESSVAGQMIEGMPSSAEAASGFADAVSGFIGNVVGLAEGYVNIKSTLLNQDSSILNTMFQSGNNLAGSMWDVLAGRFLDNSEGLNSIKSGKIDIDSAINEFIDSVTKDDSFEFVSDSVVGNKRLRKGLNSQIKKALAGAKGRADAYNSIKEAYSGYMGANSLGSVVRETDEMRFDSKGKVLKPGDEGYESGVDYFGRLAQIITQNDVLSAYMEYLGSANNVGYLSQLQNLNAPQVQANAEVAQNRYASEYYGNVDGKLSAEVQNQANDASKSQAEYDSIFNGMKADLMNLGQNLLHSEKGYEKALGGVLLMAVPYFMGQLRSALPSLPISVDNSTHNSTNHQDTYNSISGDYKNTKINNR